MMKRNLVVILVTLLAGCDFLKPVKPDNMYALNEAKQNILGKWQTDPDVYIKLRIIYEMEFTTTNCEHITRQFVMNQEYPDGYWKVIHRCAGKYSLESENILTFTAEKPEDSNAPTKILDSWIEYEKPYSINILNITNDELIITLNLPLYADQIYYFSKIQQ